MDNNVGDPDKQSDLVSPSCLGKGLFELIVSFTIAVKVLKSVAPLQRTQPLYAGQTGAIG